MKKLVLGLLLLASPIYAEIGALPGVVQTPINAGSLAAALGVSQDYSLSVSNNGASAFTWQTIYSAAPTSITVLLEGSVDCSTYATIDTSTNTAGEIRSVFGAWKCVRINNSAVGGGAGKTLTVKFTYSTGRVTGTTGSGIFIGGTFTSPILLPDGSVSAPSLAFASDSAFGHGFYRPSAGFTVWASNGNRILFGSSGFWVGSAASIGWAGTADVYGAAKDVTLYRGGTGILELHRAGTAGTPDPQTFNIYNFCDGSNCATGYEKIGLYAESNVFYLRPSASGTGTVRPLVVGGGSSNHYITLGGTALFGGSLWRPATDDTATWGNDSGRWAHVFVSRSIQSSKTTALTEGSATPVAEIAIPQTAGSNFADAVIHWAVYASDGTDSQVRKGDSYLAAVNKAGTETCSVGDIGTTVVAASSGTLACTSSCITGLTDAVRFALNCTSSLTQTTLNALARSDMMKTNTYTPQ